MLCVASVGVRRVTVCGFTIVSDGNSVTVGGGIITGLTFALFCPLVSTAWSSSLASNDHCLHIQFHPSLLQHCQL